MKKIYYYLGLLFLIFAVSPLNAQVQIGSGTTNTSSLPITSCWGYSYTQQIYLSSEINANGSITEVSFYYESGGPAANSLDWTIFLGHTAKTDFASTTDWEVIANLNQAFTGLITFPATSGWMTITLDTPFLYNGTDNLVIAVDENLAGYNCSVNFKGFAAAGRGIHYRSDSTNPDPNTPPTANNVLGTIPNVILGGITQACPTPSALSVSNTTATSTDLVWTENGTATTWDIEWGAAGFTPSGIPTIAGTTSNPYALSGLTADTSYDFYVRADCVSTGFSSWSGPYTFSTFLLANPPFIEGFTTTTTPAGWDRTGWSIGSTRGVTGNPTNNIYKNIYSASTTGSSFRSPAIGPVTAAMNLSFDYIVSLYSSPYGPPLAGSGDFVVEISTDYGTSYTILETVANNGTAGWQSKSYPLAAYAGEDVIFKITGNWVSEDWDMAFDNFYVQVPPTCDAPSNLNASAITSNSANLEWIENGTATIWDIEWGTAGFTPSGSPTITGTTTNPHLLSGLTANTSYDFYVRADCVSNGFSNWSGPYTFATPCTTIVAPWLDDVESHSATTSLGNSECWTTSSTSTYDWNIDDNGSTPSSFTGPSGAYSGTKYFYVEGGNGGSGDIAELYTPFVDLSSLTTPALQFYYHMYGSNMGDLYIDVHDGTTWTNNVASILGEQQTSQSDPWESLIVNLSTYTGVIQVRFRAVKNTSYEGDISLDNIEFMEAPSCFDPSNLTATNLTATSADLGWIENGTASTWDIEWGVTGFTPTGTPTIAGTTTNPSTITGLTAVTSYDFYVRADCGADGLSGWSGPFTFTTPCASILAPWLDDVESHTPTTSLGDSQCWTTSSQSGFDWNIDGSGSTPSSSTGPSGANSGTNYFYVEASSGSTGDEAYLITPSIDVSGLTTPALYYYYHMYGADMGDLYIDVFNNATSTWDNVDFIIGQQQTSETDPWLQNIVNLSGFTGDIQVRFRAVKGSDFESDISLDDIEVKEGPSCFAPSLLTAANFTSTSADLGWQENGTATAWDIEYGLTGFTPTGTPTQNAVTNPYTITGLTPATEYDAYVRANCGPGDFSTWVGPITFQTECTLLLSGSYTIGATGDYATFTDAVTDLTTCGVSGAVTFNVIAGSGPYNEQITIPEIYGASATNTITFNGNGETMTSTTLTDSRSLILLDGADYVTIDNLNLVTQSDEYNFVIQLTNNADFNTITACTIDMTSTFNNTGSTNAGIVVSGSLTSATSSTVMGGTDNTFTNNTIKGGYYGLTINGESSTNNSLNNVISGNAIEDFRLYGMYLRSITNAVIADNEISRPSRTDVSTFYGMYFLTSGENNLIEANRIHSAFTGAGNGGTSSAYAIYHSSVDATIGNANKVINNVFYNIESNGTIYGFYNSGSDGVHYYHNTISLDDPNATGGTTRGIYQTTTATDIEFKNNIISITRGGTGDKHALYYNTTTSVIASDYNVLYINAAAGSNNIGHLGSTSYVTLTDWQTATSGDVNSVDVDPMLANPSGGQLSPANAAVDNTGTPLGVLTDIDGNPRSATTPDIGAYEFTPPTCLQPSALTAMNITNTSADLGWTENGTATLWDIEWGIAGFTPTGSPTVTGTASNPYSLSGLLANTAYEFYVRADCGSGDLSQWSGPYMFMTECDAVVAPWTEGFENAGSIPDCWSQGATNSENWLFSNTGTGEHLGNNGTMLGSTTSGGYFAWVDDSSPHNLETTLESPFIDVSALIEPMLSFYLISDNEGDVNGNVTFSIDVWDGAAWIPEVYLSNSNTLNGGWEQIEVSLLSLNITGDIKLRFIVDETNGNGFDDDVAIDDVSVYEGFICLDPSNLTASNITTSSADLGWTENGTATMWDIEWGVAGFTPTGTPTITGVTNPYTLSGLTHNTQYEYYVRADCGGVESNWAGPFFFETLEIICDAPTALTVVNVTHSSVEVSWTASATETGGYNWFLMADGDNPLTDTPVNSGSVATGITDVIITGLSPVTDYDFYVQTICMSGVESTIEGPLNVLTTQIPCDETTAITLENVDDTSFEASWTASATETGGYNWVVMADGDDPLTDTPVTSGSVATGVTTVTVTGLTQVTDYDFYVQTICGTGVESDWAGPLNVTTDVTVVCDMPSNIVAGTITETSAELSWTASATETDGYLWVVFFAGDDPNTATPVDNGSVATGITDVTVTGLDDDTAYDFYVRTDCGVDGVSNWVGPFTFVTNLLGTEDNVIDGFAFYPNPMQDVVQVRATNNIDSIVIFSLVGQKLVDLKVGATTSQIDVSNFASGPYLMQVTSNGQTGIYRLIKE